MPDKLCEGKHNKETESVKQQGSAREIKCYIERICQ